MMGSVEEEGVHEHQPCTRCTLVEATGADDLCDECRALTEVE